jgi:hypothetical protein
MRLHEYRIGEDLGQVPVDVGPHGSRLGGLKGQARLIVHQAVPANGRFAEGEIVQLVDVIAVLRVAQEVVKEGAKPGVARFRVGGQPDDLAHAVPTRRGRAVPRYISAP